MSDIALVNRDIVASSFGDILIVDDNNDIIQMAINNILTIQGTNEFHSELGNMVYNKRHKMSSNGFKEIADMCKNAILQDPRVSNVTEIIATGTSTPENYGACNISFVLTTISGTELNSNIVISL